MGGGGGRGEGGYTQIDMHKDRKKKKRVGAKQVTHTWGKREREGGWGWRQAGRQTYKDRGTDSEKEGQKHRARDRQTENRETEQYRQKQ